MEEIKELRERNWYGILTGMVKPEAKKIHPDQVELLKNFRQTLKGGEAYDAFCKRVVRGLEQVTNPNHKIVAVVIHGGVFKNIFREIFKVGEIKNVEDCGYAEIEWDGERYKVVRLSGIEMLSM